jgi:hypothetical protein
MSPRCTKKAPLRRLPHAARLRRRRRGHALRLKYRYEGGADQEQLTGHAAGNRLEPAVHPLSAVLLQL